MSAKKILVVDDNPVVVKALQIKLAEVGFVALSASLPNEAIGVVRCERPDLILLDLNFPSDFGGVDWNGFLIMQWLRRMEESRNIPIVIITGTDSTKNRERATELGATAFFTKPIDNHRLIEVIKQTLELAATTSDTPASPVS
jgi:CheY-like chemotaxis protein